MKSSATGWIALENVIQYRDSEECSEKTLIPQAGNSEGEYKNFEMLSSQTVSCEL
jgi:hypothetical protein